MGLSVFSAPRYIYQQDAQPVGAIKGAIWVDTNAVPVTTYIYNGSAWNSLTTDVGWVANMVLEQGLNILINSVASSSTLNDWDDMFVDEFTDADGTSNTIDTANTTAGFNSGLFYENVIVGATDNLSESASGGTYSHDFTMTMTTSATGIVSSITGYSAAPGDADVNITIIQSATTKLALTGIKVVDLLNLTAGQYTSLLVSGEFTIKLEKTNSGLYRDDGNTSHAGTYLSWTDQRMHTDVTNADISFQTIVNGDAIVQTNAITCDTAQTHHQVYLHNAVAGTGAITYDISFDNGANWDTAQALNAKNPRVTATGTQMILKLNLNGTGAGNTASADDYGILLYY